MSLILFFIHFATPPPTAILLTRIIRFVLYALPLDRFPVTLNQLSYYFLDYLHNFSFSRYARSIRHYSSVPFYPLLVQNVYEHYQCFQYRSHTLNLDVLVSSISVFYFHVLVLKLWYVLTNKIAIHSIRSPSELGRKKFSIRYAKPRG